LPDFRQLAVTDYWRKPRSMVGVNGADVDAQLAFVELCCTPDLIDVLKSKDLVSYGISQNEEVGYGAVEAQFLYYFIATQRPARMVQVGAGFSTAIILLAAADAGFPIEITCIDPFP